MAQPAYTRSQLVALAAADARKHGVDPSIFTRQIQQESGFNPTVSSSAGAQGIAQFMPSTARSYGIDPLNPVQALNAAAQYDQNELKAFGGDYRKALAAYNAGAGNADKWNDPNFAGGQTYRYVQDVLGGSGVPSVSGGVPSLARAAAQPVTAPGVVAPRSPVSLLPQLSAASQGGDYSQFYAALGNALKQGSLPGSPAPRSALASAASSVGKQTLATGKTAVQYAKQQLGVPYQWGGETAGKGFDCSGLLQAAWKNAGVSIPRTTYDQWQTGKPVPVGQLEPGDAVFFKGSDSKTVNGQVLPGHVGIYLGGGKIIEAPHTGASVEVSTLAGRSDLMGARRYA